MKTRRFRLVRPKWTLGTMLLIVGWSAVVLCRGAVAAHEPTILKGHTDHVLSVAYSPDGRKVASAGHGRAIILWDVSTGESIWSIRCAHGNGIMCLAFSPDGKTIASTGRRTVKLWDVGKGEIKKTIQDTGRYYGVTFSPDGETLAAAAYGSILLWDVSAGRLLRTLPCELSLGDVTIKHRVSSVAFSPNGRFLSGGCHDVPTVWIWNPTTGNVKAKLPGHSEGSSSVAFSPDGRTLAAATGFKGTGSVKIWEVETAKLKRELCLKDPLVMRADGTGIMMSGIDGVAFSPDGKTLASVCDVLILWDVDTGKRRFISAGSSRSPFLACSVAFSPDGTTLATSGYDQTVKLWPVNQMLGNQ